MKTFKQYLKESKSLNESLIPKNTTTQLSLFDTGYDYLDDNYEQSYFEVSSKMIRSMINCINKQSDRQWVDASMAENEEEAAKEKKEYIKILNDWAKIKFKEENLLNDIYNIIYSVKFENNKFDHDKFIKLIKQYLKDFEK